MIMTFGLRHRVANRIQDTENSIKLEKFSDRLKLRIPQETVHIAAIFAVWDDFNISQEDMI